MKEISLTMFGDLGNSFINIYYKGSQSDWNNIVFAGYEYKTSWQQLVSENYSDLDDITMHFNS